MDSDMLFGISKFKIIDIFIIAIFGITFFSIPAFSFQGYGKYITWILSIILFVCIAVSIFLYHKLIIDSVALSLVLFAFFAFFASLIGGFQAFKKTAILLSLTTFIIYVYCKSTKHTSIPNYMFLSAFIGVALFLVLYLIKYREELISLNFTRLGDEFGDNNDISIFLGLGLLFSFYYLLFEKNKVLKIVSAMLIPLFVLTGFSTGSKIFVLILLISFVLYPILFFGKKKWWCSVLFILLSIIIFLIVINLPFFETIKKRMDDFISTILGHTVGDGKVGEASTLNRFNMFVCGVEMWLRRPIFGWGIWGFSVYSGGSGGWSHNDISESLCNFGLLGSILFHFGFYTSLKNYFKTDNKKNLALPLMILSLFIACMLSVALNSQKIYSYIIGIVFSQMDESYVFFEFKFNHHKHIEQVEELL